METFTDNDDTLLQHRQTQTSTLHYVIFRSVCIKINLRLVFYRDKIATVPVNVKNSTHQLYVIVLAGTAYQ